MQCAQMRVHSRREAAPQSPLRHFNCSKRTRILDESSKVFFQPLFHRRFFGDNVQFDNRSPQIGTPRYETKRHWFRFLRGGRDLQAPIVLVKRISVRVATVRWRSKTSLRFNHLVKSLSRGNSDSWTFMLHL